MGQVTEEMRRNVEEMMEQLQEYEARLRKQEKATIAKIDAERALAEKANHRRDFYAKMEENMERGHEEATANLDAAEKAQALVEQKVAELEASRAELQVNLAEVDAKNKELVAPELERLETLLQASKDEIAVSARALSDDRQRLEELTILQQTIGEEEKALQHTITQKEGALADLLAKPAAITDSTEDVRRQTEALQSDLDDIERHKAEVEQEIKTQQQRRSAIDEQKTAEVEKLQSEERALEERRLRVEGCKAELANEKVRQHSLASQRVEIELYTKKARDEIRHTANVLTAENRQIKLQKTALAKKQAQIPQMKAKRDELQSKQRDLGQTISLIEAEKKALEETLAALKYKVEASLMAFCDEQYVAEDALERLDSTMKSVAEKECEIEEMRSEEKKSSTLLSLMKEKRALTRRKIEQAAQMRKDLEMAVAVQEVQQQDLRKQIRDTESRAADFATLHQMVASEKGECTRLIEETNKALGALRVRTEEYQCELRAKSEEREVKMETLSREIAASRVAQHARATKRTAKSQSWSEYRQALETVERQEANVQKLKSTLSSSRKVAEATASQVKQMDDLKLSLAGQLRERKAQITALYVTANNFRDGATIGELSIQRTEQQLHTVGLKNKDIQRSLTLLERELQSEANIEQQINEAKRKLEAQVIQSERIIAQLECPSRVQFASGADPTSEELAAKLSILERLVQQKKEALLDGEITSKELSLRVRQQEEANQNWKDSTASLLQETNEYRARIMDLERRRTAQMSELQLYDQLIVNGKAKMAELRHDISLREQLAVAAKLEGEKLANSNDALPSGDSTTPPLPTRRLSCERPTAYLPDDDADDLTLKVPRPYGGMAPFRAVKPGASMRHVKKPTKLDPLL